MTNDHNNDRARNCNFNFTVTANSKPAWNMELNVLQAPSDLNFHDKHAISFLWECCSNIADGVESLVCEPVTDNPEEKVPVYKN